MTGRGSVAFYATILWALAFLPPAATAQETKPAEPTAASPQPTATAQESIGEYLKEKRIVWTVSCQRAGRATRTWELNQRGNLTLKDHPTKQIQEIVNGQAVTEFFNYSAVLEDGVLTVTEVSRKLKDVRFTDTLKITNNTCSMKHKVEPGAYASALDPTCKAVTCTVQTIPAR